MKCAHGTPRAVDTVDAKQMAHAHALADILVNFVRYAYQLHSAKHVKRSASMACTVMITVVVEMEVNACVTLVLLVKNVNCALIRRLVKAFVRRNVLVIRYVMGMEDVVCISSSQAFRGESYLPKIVLLDQSVNVLKGMGENSVKCAHLLL